MCISRGIRGQAFSAATQSLAIVPARLRGDAGAAARVMHLFGGKEEFHHV